MRTPEADVNDGGTPEADVNDGGARPDHWSLLVERLIKRGVFQEPSPAFQIERPREEPPTFSPRLDWQVRDRALPREDSPDLQAKVAIWEEDYFGSIDETIEREMNELEDVEEDPPPWKIDQSGCCDSTYWKRQFKMQKHGLWSCWQVLKLLLSPGVVCPTLLVAACCHLAHGVIEMNQLGDEEYGISEQSPTQWLAKKLSPAIDVGSEAHEMAGLVLGFLLAYQAQRAADRFNQADESFRRMSACLKVAASQCIPNLKQSKFTQSKIHLHWEFGRLLLVLLTMSARDLRSGSLGGVFGAEELEMLSRFGISHREQSALASADRESRVHLSLHWLLMVVDAAVDYKWLQEYPASTVSDKLSEFLGHWTDARCLSHAQQPVLLDGFLVILLFTFCCTLPFPLAAALGAWCYPAAISVALAFFGLKAAASRMMEPFGNDASDVNLFAYCNDFELCLKELVETLAWRPTQSEETHLIPWGPQQLKPGLRSGGPPGGKNLKILISQHLACKYRELGMRQEQAKHCLRQNYANIRRLSERSSERQQTSVPRRDLFRLNGPELHRG